MKTITEFNAYLKDIVLLAEYGIIFSDCDPELMVVNVKDMENVSNNIRVRRIQMLNERYRTQRGKSK
jgi:hypothetical protein